MTHGIALTNVFKYRIFFCPPGGISWDWLKEVESLIFLMFSRQPNGTLMHRLRSAQVTLILNDCYD